MHVEHCRFARLACPYGELPLPYILVVDNDAAVARLVARALEDTHSCVYVASGPSSALAIVQREARSPAILISDVHLVTGDGRDLAQRLRHLYPRLPVLLMSGGFARGEEPELTSRGPQRFMHKPFEGKQLRMTVSQLLAERSAV